MYIQWRRLRKHGYLNRKSKTQNQYDLNCVCRWEGRTARAFQYNDIKNSLCEEKLKKHIKVK